MADSSGPQWEYKTITHEVADEELSKIGRDGWEAVAAYVVPSGRLHTLFKRRRTEEA